MNKTLLTIIFLLFSVYVSDLWADEQEERELSALLFEQILDFAETTLEEWDSVRTMYINHQDITHHRLGACRTLAWLYRYEDPANPYFGDTAIRDIAIEMGNILTDPNYLGLGYFQYHGEWLFYTLCQTYELLEEELTEENKMKWRRYAEFYLATRGKRPMFYTAYHHEAGNTLGILRAGQVFGVPEWEERGKRLMHQLLKVQTNLGYFDEGPHHGPSTRYNMVQLTVMLLFYDYTGDKEVLSAAKRLADFMIRYAFPDGSTSGALDGRRIWSLGFTNRLCYGLDRWPRGKELNRRIFRTLKKWGFYNYQSPFVTGLDTGALWRGWWIVDEYLSLRPEAPSSALPQDTDGYVMAESATTFVGGVARNYGWMVVLSAINSDIPRQSNSIYRLDRQSRIDIWHESAGMLIGGGHNLRDTDLPLANFQLLTGHAGVDSEFGLLSGGSYHDKRAVYMPRAVAADITAERQILRQTFGQGDVSLIVEQLDKHRLTIRYEYDVFTLKKLFVQIPLILFYNSSLYADGRRVGRDKFSRVEREVRLTNPTMKYELRLTVPQGLEAAVNQPVWTRSYYMGYHGDVKRNPYYCIKVLSYFR